MKHRFAILDCEKIYQILRLNIGNVPLNLQAYRYVRNSISTQKISEHNMLKTCLFIDVLYHDSEAGRFVSRYIFNWIKQYHNDTVFFNKVKMKHSVTNRNIFFSVSFTYSAYCIKSILYLNHHVLTAYHTRFDQ